MYAKNNFNLKLSAVCIALVVLFSGIAIVSFVLMMINYTSENPQNDKLHVVFSKLEQKFSNIGDEIISIKKTLANITLDEEDQICLDELCENFPNNLNSLNLNGCWNANINDPTISSGIGVENEAYVVCVGGNTSIDGNDNWERGDLILYQTSQNAWLKNDGSFDELSNNWNFLGCWDADSNNPVITSGMGTEGDAYIVCTNGTTSIDGNSDWLRGDLLIYVAGTQNRWFKNDGTPESNRPTGINITADQCINPTTTDSPFIDRYGNQMTNIFRLLQVGTSTNNGTDTYQQGLVFQQETFELVEPISFDVPNTISFNQSISNPGLPQTPYNGLALLNDSAAQATYTRIGNVIYIDASFGVQQNPLVGEDIPFTQAMIALWNFPGSFFCPYGSGPCRVRLVGVDITGYNVFDGTSTATLTEDERICLIGNGGFFNNETILEAPIGFATLLQFSFPINYYNTALDVDDQPFEERKRCAVTARIVVVLDDFLDADSFCKTGMPSNGNMFGS
jgi:hypothetical protein